MTRPNSPFYDQPPSSANGTGSISSDFRSIFDSSAEHVLEESLRPHVTISERDTTSVADRFPPDHRSITNPLNVVPGWLTIRTLPSQTDTYRVGKRIFDLALAVLTLPLVALSGGLIAILIFVTSGGPIFYRQTRIGQYGRKFKIIKFRTMLARSERVLLEFLEANPDASLEWTQTHKLRDDPRVTRLGRFLRKTSLDELPQIINVFHGEMSFVGPRPIVHAEREKYGDRFVYYTAVVPGITGLWQVSGRCDVTYDDRVSLDERYARTWDPMLDMSILCKTPRAVCRGRGAY